MTFLMVQSGESEKLLRRSVVAVCEVLLACVVSRYVDGVVGCPVLGCRGKKFGDRI